MLWIDCKMVDKKSWLLQEDKKLLLLAGSIGQKKAGKNAGKTGWIMVVDCYAGLVVCWLTGAGWLVVLLQLVLVLLVAVGLLLDGCAGMVLVSGIQKEREEPERQNGKMRRQE